MRDILLLTKIELQKISKTGLAKISIIALLIIILCFIITEYMDIYEYRHNIDYQNEVMSWQERETNLINFATEDLESPYYNDFEKEQISKRIEIAKYRLKNNIPKYIYKNVWWFFNNNSFDWIIRVVVVIIVCVGCSNMGGEYSGKTLRQILILPYKRSKILTGKFLAIATFGVVLYFIVFIMGIVSGLVIHGFSGFNSEVVLYYGSEIVTMNMSLYSLILVVLKIVELIFGIVLTVFLSVITKSSSISAVIGIGITLLAEPISNFIAEYYSLFYYLPFTNLDFRRYLDFGTVMPSIESGLKTPIVGGITVITSVAIIVITLIIMSYASYAVFKNQEV